MSTFALEHFNKEVYDMLHDGIQNVFVYRITFLNSTQDYIDIGSESV